MSDLAGSGINLTLSRHFDAEPHRVFDAWICPDWGDWLAPRGASCRVTAIDPRAGGQFQVAMSMPDGRSFGVSGTYREVQRPDRLVFTWQGDLLGSCTLVTVTFRAEGAGTLMTLRQEGFEQAKARVAYQSGWSGDGGSFEKLAALLRREVAHG